MCEVTLLINVEMLGIQLLLNFIVFLLNIFDKLHVLGKFFPNI